MRCQVNLSDEMVEKVDCYAKKMGVSRSSLCSVLIGQGIMSYEKSMDMMDSLLDSFKDNLDKNIFKNK